MFNFFVFVFLVLPHNGEKPKISILCSCAKFGRPRRAVRWPVTVRKIRLFASESLHVRVIVRSSNGTCSGARRVSEAAVRWGFHVYREVHPISKKKGLGAGRIRTNVFWSVNRTPGSPRDTANPFFLYTEKQKRLSFAPLGNQRSYNTHEHLLKGPFLVLPDPYSWNQEIPESSLACKCFSSSGFLQHLQ